MSQIGMCLCGDKGIRRHTVKISFLVDPFMFCCFLFLSAAFHLHLHKSSLFKLLSQVCPFSRPEFLKHKLFIVPNIHKNIKKKIEIFWHFLFAERICTEKRIFSISFYERYWSFRYKKIGLWVSPFVLVDICQCQMPWSHM